MRTVTIPRSRVFHGPLAVVNRSHPLRGDIPTDLAAPDDRYPDILMERRAARLLSACIRHVGGGQEIRPVSGWRSREEQQSIWDMALAEEGAAFTRKYVALPGCSEHQSGLAIDLGRACEPVDPICPDFPYDGVFGAFRRAAADYGFIERYQSGKEHLTGIAAEPWHFRYVGVPHARLMEKNDLCLEEYRAFVQRNTPISLEEHGRKVRITYLPCLQEAMDLPLPDGRCQISGDNVGGFILTVWRDTP